MVIDSKTEEAVQRIGPPSAWLGLAWSHDGAKLFVSGGMPGHPRRPMVAPIYVFDYSNGRLSEKPLAEWREDLLRHKSTGPDWQCIPNAIFYMPPTGEPTPTGGHIGVFDTDTGRFIANIPVDVSPYDLQFNEDGPSFTSATGAVTTSA